MNNYDRADFENHTVKNISIIFTNEIDFAEKAKKILEFLNTIDTLATQNQDKRISVRAAAG
jgi:hypothetical protein